MADTIKHTVTFQRYAMNDTNSDPETDHTLRQVLKVEDGKCVPYVPPLKHANPVTGQLMEVYAWYKQRTGSQQRLTFVPYDYEQVDPLTVPITRDTVFYGISQNKKYYAYFYNVYEGVTSQVVAKTENNPIDYTITLTDIEKPEKFDNTKYSGEVYYTTNLTDIDIYKWAMTSDIDIYVHYKPRKCAINYYYCTMANGGNYKLVNTVLVQYNETALPYIYENKSRRIQTSTWYPEGEFYWDKELGNPYNNEDYITEDLNFYGVGVGYLKITAEDLKDVAGVEERSITVGNVVLSGHFGVENGKIIIKANTYLQITIPDSFVFYYITINNPKDGIRIYDMYGEPDSIYMDGDMTKETLDYTESLNASECSIRYQENAEIESISVFVWEKDLIETTEES